MHNVLYVDDERALLDLVKVFLEEMGDFSVDTLLSAPEALKQLEKKDYDAVISDYQMAPMDGIAFLKSVRASKNPIPFILFTGKGREEIVIQALNEGADFYLQKGGGPQAQFAELAHKIRQAIHQRKADQSIREHEHREADIINFLPDATFAIDAEGKVIAWNRAMEDFTGVLAAEILGKGNYEYALPIYHKRRPILIDMVLRPDPEAEKEYPYILRSGKKLFSEIFLPDKKQGAGALVWFTASPFYDTQGRLVGAIESIRDITERKRSEEALIASNTALKKQARTLGILNRIITTANCAKDPRGLLEKTLEKILLLLDYDAGGIYRVDTATGMASVVVSRNIPQEFLAEVGTIPRTRPPYDMLFVDGTPLFTDHYDIAFPAHHAKTGFLSIASVPLRTRDRITGALNVVSRRRNRISEDEKEALVAIGRELGSALERIGSEAEVRLAAANLEVLFTSVDEMVFLLDSRGVIVRVNETAQKRLGYPGNELIGQEAVRLHPHDRQDEARAILQGILFGTTATCPVPLLAKDGTVMDVTTRITRGWWDDREVVIAISHDNPAACPANGTPEENEELLRLAFNNANDAIFLLEQAPDGPGKYLLVNEKAIRMLGYSREELLIMSPRDIVPADIQAKVMPVVRELLTRNGHATFESAHKRKDGSIYPVEVSTYTFRFRGKDIDLSIARDITRQKLALEALRQNEEHLRNLISATADIVWETDQNGVFLYISPQAERILGYRPDELVGRTAWEFLLPATVEANRKAFHKAAMRKDRFISHDSHWLHKDGRQVILESRAIPVTDSQGNPAGFHGIDRDITERVAAQEALRESEEKFRSLVEYGLEGILILDFSGTILFANKAARITAGVTGTAGLIGENVMQYIAPESRHQVIADFEQVKKSQDAFLTEYEVITRDHQRIWIECIGKKITYEGKPADLISFRDITERKLASRALEESEERYRHIFESLDDLYYQTDTEGIITVLSPSLERLTGWTQDELIGKPVTMVYVNPDDRRGLLAGIDDNGHVRDHELLLLKKDGTHIPVSISANRIFTADGAPEGVAGILRDISKRKERDNALRLANMKLTLLSGIARHDIRNQVMALKAYLLLAKESLDKPTLLADYLSWEQKSADTIERQIKFTRDYEEMAATPPGWQAVEDCIQKSVAALPLQDIAVTTDVAGLSIYADPLLEKVFHNLIDNALRYGGDVMSGIRLSAEQNDGVLVLSLTDDGIGIAPDEKEIIFTRGYGKNTGLGLFLAREILGISGITIRECGIPGRGARFEMTVPAGKWRFSRR
ncbi:MAG: PAS domain S-box protein [Methanomicrobiales archaeon]|nr:PAS domain S-box protein [Methanomicrobiales archaeon]